MLEVNTVCRKSLPLEQETIDKISSSNTCSAYFLETFLRGIRTQEICWNPSLKESSIALLLGFIIIWTIR
jgi:hypothetical protein